MARKGENIYKRKDGRWEGRYRTEYNKYHSVYGKTYADVKEKLIRLKVKPVTNKSSGNLTVKDLFTEWLSAVKLKVKDSTYANYTMKYEKHIAPEFDNVRYNLLTANMVHIFIDKKLRDGLSAKYVSDIVIVFKSMAKYIAKTYGFQNVLGDVILPKTEKTEMKILSKQHQEILHRYLIKNLDRKSLCILLSLYTGLRIGEICGLKWSDIDFEHSALTVRRTVQRIRKGTHGTKLITGTPKSKSSCRTIPVPEFLMKILSKFRSYNDNYILSDSEKATEPRTLQHRFKATLEKAQLPSVNYHSLRHMFATNCLYIGFDIKTLSEILGHSSVETTLNRYVHSSMEQKYRCMSLLNPAV